MTKVVLHPDQLDQAAGGAVKLADALDRAEKAITGVALSGLPPSAMTRAQAAKTSAVSVTRQAESDSRAQAPKLRKRADLARKADGYAYQFFTDLMNPPSPYDVAGYIDELRLGLRGNIRGNIEKETLARKKYKHAKKLWESEPWRQKKWSDPRKMFKELKRTPINQIRKGEKIAKYLDAKSLVPKGVRTSPIVRSVGASGVVRNPIVRKLGSKIPLIGAGFTYLGNKNDGEDRSDLDAAVKTGVQMAGSAAGGAAGAAVCGGATAATLGLGAATCPVLIFGGAVIGDKVAGALYDPGKKAIGALADGGKKVWGWTGL